MSYNKFLGRKLVLLLLVMVFEGYINSLPFSCCYCAQVAVFQFDLLSGDILTQVHIMLLHCLSEKIASSKANEVSFAHNSLSLLSGDKYYHILFEMDRFLTLNIEYCPMVTIYRA